MRQLLVIIKLFVTAIILYFLYLLLFPLICPIDESNSSDQFFCGVVDTPISHNEVFLAGKDLFYKNCAQCHSKTMRHDATGPALSSSIRKWSVDTIAFLSYTNGDEAFKGSSGSDFSPSGENNASATSYTHRYKFNLTDAKSIIEYIVLQSR